MRELATGPFLAHQRNVVLVGGTGSGKTHLAIATARACIRDGSRGRFFNVVDLVNRLEAEARAGRARRIADHLARLDFVVMDEPGCRICEWPLAVRREQLHVQVVAAAVESHQQEPAGGPGYQLGDRRERGNADEAGSGRQSDAVRRRQPYPDPRKAAWPGRGRDDFEREGRRQAAVITRSIIGSSASPCPCRMPRRSDASTAPFAPPPPSRPSRQCRWPARLARADQTRHGRNTAGSCARRGRSTRLATHRIAQASAKAGRGSAETAGPSWP